jgi:glyoxylase-like metal-dependent hydrolase (beta-lactamase superfamily II)
LTLFDAGPPTEAAWGALCHGLAEHGYAVTDLRQLVVSHAHPDHSGQAARVAAASGARILAHSEEAVRLRRHRSEWEAGSRFIFQELCRAGAPEKALARRMAQVNRGRSPMEPLIVSQEVGDGEPITRGADRWEAIHLPGHSPGLLGLHAPRRQELLASDHLLPETDSRPGLYAPTEGGAQRPRTMPAYAASLKRVAGLNVRTTWPAHGRPIQDTQALIARRLAHQRERAEEIAAILLDSARTAYEIWKALFPRILPLDPYNGVIEIINYLDLLEAEGRVRPLERDGLVFYTAAGGSAEIDAAEVHSGADS